MKRRHAIRAAGKSPLFQFWTSQRFRIFLRGAASKLGVTQSELVRVAVWEHIQRVLSPQDRRRFTAQAVRAEQAGTEPQKGTP